jgi:hypothetical protein
LLRVSILGTEDALNAGVFLFINWGVPPNRRGGLVRVEVRMVRVVSAFLEKNLADEELSRWDLDKAFL